MAFCCGPLRASRGIFSKQNIAYLSKNYTNGTATSTLLGGNSPKPRSGSNATLGMKHHEQSRLRFRSKHYMLSGQAPLSSRQIRNVAESKPEGPKKVLTDFATHRRYAFDRFSIAKYSRYYYDGRHYSIGSASFDSWLFAKIGNCFCVPLSFAFIPMLK